MNSSDRNQARKLASYSTAALLGAFGAHQAAQGAIIYTNLEPDGEVTTSNTSGNGVEIDLDNNGAADVSIHYLSNSMRVLGLGGASILTDTDGGAANTYYVRGFELGELLDATTPAESGPGNIAKDFGGSEQFIGVAFDIAGNTHFGWVGFQIDDPNNQHAIIRDYAYEDVAGTGIETGTVPEPGSLALLAAGAGAIGLRRRRQARD